LKQKPGESLGIAPGRVTMGRSGVLPQGILKRLSFVVTAQAGIQTKSSVGGNMSRFRAAARKAGFPPARE
jgi:hypothetical protein